VNFFSKLYYVFRKAWKAVRLYLVLAGPGIVVMVADNDAGGITTYAATGAKYGYHLIWFLLILIPVAYYVQEMTVRLGAVTKRGLAEAIFDGFGAFGLVLATGPADCRLADADHRIRRHDGGPRHIRRAPWLTVVAVIALMGVMS